MTRTDLSYDPWDSTIDADRYPVWRRLRDEAPVYHDEPHDFYALSRYENFPMMIMKKPPEHTNLRELVSRAFIPRRIADLEHRIAQPCGGDTSVPMQVR